MNFYYVFAEHLTLSSIIMGDFHNYIMMYLILILSFLLILMFRKITCQFYFKTLLSSELLELIWTILPMIILIFIALPSIFYLYILDSSVNPSVTLKIFGAQWYWIYEYSDFKNSSISSYMLKYSDLVNSDPCYGPWRLLEVDVRAVLPAFLEIRLLISSEDVIHSFSIPGLGIKVDAIPGRLNSTSISVMRFDTFYGQCAEICGVGHSFMPIVIEFISAKDFLKAVYNDLIPNFSV